MMDGTGPGRNEYQGMYVIFDHHSEEELELIFSTSANLA
jgi:hypothetical protein